VTKKPTKHRLPGMSCPHCNSPSTVRFARPLSAMVREVTYRCENDDCGHGFVAQIAAIRTTIPSANPNPTVHLPFAKPGMLAPVPAPQPAAKPVPTPANDDGQPVVHPPAANDAADLMTG